MMLSHMTSPVTGLQNPVRCFTATQPVNSGSQYAIVQAQPANDQLCQQQLASLAAHTHAAAAHASKDQLCHNVDDIIPCRQQSAD